MTRGALNSSVTVVSKRYRSRSRLRRDAERKSHRRLPRGRDFRGGVALRAVAADGGVAVVTSLAVAGQSFQVTVTGAGAVACEARQVVVTRVLETRGIAALK